MLKRRKSNREKNPFAIPTSPEEIARSMRRGMRER